MIAIIKKIFPITLGCAAGYAWWYFIGCASGSCPITSHWYTTVAYGGMVGATFLIPPRKEKQEADRPNQR